MAQHETNRKVKAPSAKKKQGSKKAKAGTASPRSSRKKKAGSKKRQSRAVEKRAPSSRSSSPPSDAEADAQKRNARAFLPDEVIAAHWFFRLLLWINRVWYWRWHGCEHHGFERQRPDKATLFYTRHSTHNSDILTLLALCWQMTGKVPRALLHRLIIRYYPILRYIGCVAGERASAVALLKQNFWSGVIPGGADEGLVGHENAYRVQWGSSRVGFAKVAMDADARIVPFFLRNNEESRFNPIIELWHLLRLHVPYHAVVRAKVPYVSAVVRTLAHCLWFTATFFQIPVPVRCTLIFGDPIPYRPDEPTEAVVSRAREALQRLIDANQPNARQGRNYMRALGERWPEWRATYPRFIRAVERSTPGFVKRFLQRWAQGTGKKRM